MKEYRSVEGKLKILQAENDFIFPVELWLLNDKVNRNNWKFVNLEEHRAEWAGKPILVAYVNGGRKTGDGHNQATRIDKNGEKYQSFTDATAERIVGALGEKPEDIRIEEADGAQWVVGKGFLWEWYAHELVLQIADWAQQGRSMSVSIEALVTEGYMDGEVEVETQYVPLGVTVLGEGVAPAVPDAHIAMLSEAESEFKELKLRAASYIGKKDASQEPQKTKNEGVKKRMRLNKQQLREIQLKFTEHTVLAAEQSESGILVCLMNNAGQTAVYRMGSLDEVVVPERITEINAQVHFSAEGCDDVLVDAADMVEKSCKDAECAKDEAECAKTELAECKEKIAQMEAAENVRRLEAAKKMATDTLDAFNANRESKVDVRVLEALNKDIEDGKFTALCAEDGKWIGEQSVKEKVLSLCAAAIMELDKKNAAQPMTWGSVKKASAAPGTIGELFASKN